MKNWIKNLFDKESPVSSKRFAGIVLLVWAIIAASWYILKVQWNGSESNTTVSIIEFSIVSACGLLAGGTLAEQIGSGIGKSKGDKNEEDDVEQ